MSLALDVGLLENDGGGCDADDDSHTSSDIGLLVLVKVSLDLLELVHQFSLSRKI